MEFQSKVTNKVLKAQSREIIANVMTFMRSEAESNEPVSVPKLKKVVERVAIATGVSKATVKRIKQEMIQIRDGAESSFSTPNKKRRKRAPKTDLDNFDKGVLRRFIIDHYVIDKKFPTLKRIHKKFVEENEYAGSRESLRRLLLQMGFRWTKTKTNRTLLMEKPEIQQIRLNFLRRMKQYREENRSIVYMDETYIHTSHTNSNGWYDNTDDGLTKPIGKGQSLIIVHAGGENGFVQNACLMFMSNTKSGDYHSEMSFTNYKKWLQEKLIPNLPPKSILVIDNAPYHNVQVDKCPNITNRKEDMQNWLTRRNIPFTVDMLKVDLYTIIKLHKPRFKTFEINNILEKAGHCVLRLPPHHPELNPIKLVWDSLKSYVAERNANFNLIPVNMLCEQFFNSLSLDKWKMHCEHAKLCEKYFMEKEPMLDTVIDTLIINLSGSNDSESDSEDEVPSDSDSDFS